MVAIIDYGVGNLFSLQSSFAAIGAEVTVTVDKAVLEAAGYAVILQGEIQFLAAAFSASASGP